MMKNKKSFFSILGFILLCSATFAQDNVGDPVKNAVIFGKEQDFRAIKAEGIEYNNTSGNINIGLTEVNFASKLKQSGMFVAGSSSTQYNRLLVFNFNPSLVSKGITAEAYTQAGGNLDNYNRQTMSTSQMLTKPLAEIVKSYPAFYIVPANKMVTYSSPYLFGMTLQTKKFDESLNEYMNTGESKNVTISKKKPSENVTPSQNYCMDDINQNIATYFGKKTEEKYSEQKYLVFATYNQQGNMLNTCEVNLPFPRNLAASMLLRSKTNQDEIVGKAFFFKRMMMFGKKYNDPEKNNYEIVAIDNQGKLILYKTFKVGDADKSGFNPYYAILDGPKVWVLGDYSNSNNFGFIIKTFGTDGSETTKEIGKEIINTKKLYDKNVSTRSSKVFDGVGITFNVSQEFIGMGHVLASNGDLLIWGRTIKKVDDPNYKPDPNQPSMFKPQVTQYCDLACIHINQASELTALYGSLLKDSYESSPITVTNMQDKIIFTATNAKRAISETETNVFKVPSILNPSVTWSYPYKQMYTPKFIVITPSTTKIDSQTPVIADFTLFNTEKFSVIASNKSTIYYFGYTLDIKKAEMKVVVDEFKF